MHLSRRERRDNGLLAWQLAVRAIRLHREGVDLAGKSSDELAVLLAADMMEDGLPHGIDWERLIELILKYLPQIIELILKLL